MLWSFVAYLHSPAQVIDFDLHWGRCMTILQCVIGNYQYSTPRTSRSPIWVFPNFGQVPQCQFYFNFSKISTIGSEYT